MMRLIVVAGVLALAAAIPVTDNVAEHIAQRQKMVNEINANPNTTW